MTDPLNKTRRFPDNQIPLSRFNPVAVKLLAYYPLPNRADPRNNYITAANDRGCVGQLHREGRSPFQREQHDELPLPDPVQQHHRLRLPAARSGLSATRWMTTAR